MKNMKGKIHSIKDLQSIIQNTPMISPGLPVGWNENRGRKEAEKVLIEMQKSYPNSRLIASDQDTSYYAKIILPHLDNLDFISAPTVILSMIGDLTTIQDSQLLNTIEYENLVKTLLSMNKKFVPYELFKPHESNLLGWDGRPYVELAHEGVWRSLFDYL